MEVREITRDDYKPYIFDIHYAHRMPTITDAYGLYINKVLSGVCTFGIPASHSLCIGICGKDYQDDVLELNRLCVDEGLAVPTSQFVSKCLKLLQNKHGGRVLVSYADTDMGHIGIIYQATNWIYTGATKERTDIGLEDGTHSRHYDKDLDYSANRVKRSSKHRYVKFIGNKTYKKNALKNLRYQIMSYPKGETQRYKTGHVGIVQGVFL